VVGAGPAGSSAALAARRAGASVLLLERAAIPRYKTCGGGLIGTSRQLLAAAVRVPVRARVREAAFTLNGRWRFTRRAAEGTFLDMVYRDELDAALVEAAKAAGAEVRSRTALRQLTELDDHVLLETTGGAVAARTVIGADGSTSRVGNHVGVRCGQTDLALEVELPLPESRRGEWAERMLIDWGPLPGSYAWVFPKGDTVTVGVIAYRGAADPTRAYLADFVRRLGLEAIEPQRSSGHLTRCREDGSPLRRGRVLVAGDAAGLLDPWTREGISFALRSGHMAGEAAGAAAARATSTAVEAALCAYERDVSATLVPEMRGGARVLQAFGRHPALFHAALLTPIGWAFFLRLCQGETNVIRAVRHPGVRAALALMAGMPARTGRPA
jgi:geranylgeranyl reductase family protein